MHELSLVSNVVDMVQVEAAARGILHVRRITLRIGKLQAVAPEALQFCFNACAEGTLSEGAELTIEHVPIEVRCRQCSADSGISDYRFRCRICGSDQVTVISGNELDVESFEA